MRKGMRVFFMNNVLVGMIRNFSLKWPMIRNPWEKDELDWVIGVHHTQQLNCRFFSRILALESWTNTEGWSLVKFQTAFFGLKMCQR